MNIKKFRILCLDLMLFASITFFVNIASASSLFYPSVDNLGGKHFSQHTLPEVKVFWIGAVDRTGNASGYGIEYLYDNSGRFMEIYEGELDGGVRSGQGKFYKAEHSGDGYEPHSFYWEGIIEEGIISPFRGIYMTGTGGISCSAVPQFQEMSQSEQSTYLNNARNEMLEKKDSIAKNFKNIQENLIRIKRGREYYEQKNFDKAFNEYKIALETTKDLPYWQAYWQHSVEKENMLNVFRGKISKSDPLTNSLLALYLSAEAEDAQTAFKYAKTEADKQKIAATLLGTIGELDNIFNAKVISTDFGEGAVDESQGFIGTGGGQNYYPKSVVNYSVQLSPQALGVLGYGTYEVDVKLVLTSNYYVKAYTPIMGVTGEQSIRNVRNVKLLLNENNNFTITESVNFGELLRNRVLSFLGNPGQEATLTGTKINAQVIHVRQVN